MNFVNGIFLVCGVLMCFESSWTESVLKGDLINGLTLRVLSDETEELDLGFDEIESEVEANKVEKQSEVENDTSGQNINNNSTIHQQPTSNQHQPIHQDNIPIQKHTQQPQQSKRQQEEEIDNQQTIISSNYEQSLELQNLNNQEFPQNTSQIEDPHIPDPSFEDSTIPEPSLDQTIPESSQEDPPIPEPSFSPLVKEPHEAPQRPEDYDIDEEPNQEENISSIEDPIKEENEPIQEEQFEVIEETQEVIQEENNIPSQTEETSHENEENMEGDPKEELIFPPENDKEELIEPIIISQSQEEDLTEQDRDTDKTEIIDETSLEQIKLQEEIEEELEIQNEQETTEKESENEKYPNIFENEPEEEQIEEENEKINLPESHKSSQPKKEEESEGENLFRSLAYILILIIVAFIIFVWFYTHRQQEKSFDQSLEMKIYEKLASTDYRREFNREGEENVMLELGDK